MMKKFFVLVSGVLVVATTAYGERPTYPKPVADGAVIFTRVTLPEGNGYEYSYFRVIEQTMNPEIVRLEWKYWQSSEQNIEEANVASGSGSFKPPEPIEVSLATLHWSGNRSGFGWFSTSPLVRGEVQKYATYMCVVQSPQGKSLNEALSQCDFKARW